MPNVTAVLGGGGESGSGYRIGDNYVLTAGHVVYDWINLGTFPPNIDSGGLTVALDFRGYFSQFGTLVNGWAASWPVLMSDGTTITNDDIGGHPTLAMRDSVLIEDSGGDVLPADEGLVVFLDNQDLLLTNSSTYFGSTTAVIRRDQGSTPDTGTILAVDPNGGGVSSTHPNPPWAVAGGVPIPGTLRFSAGSIHGDSGGAYLLQYEGKEFVLGTHFGNFGYGGPSTVQSIGTYFSYDEWKELNVHIRGSLTENVTDREPTNLIIGKDTSDGEVKGSYRADVILGREGDETLIGEEASFVAWGNDQLFGGGGIDKFRGGRGFDLLHGGDHRTYSGTRVAIVDDGIDTADYKDQTKLIKIKLVATGEGDQTFAATPDFSHAIFVETTADTYLDGATTKTTFDTLISIETIEGSDYKDVVYIKSLTALPLANADGKGGLAEIDLRGETAAAGDSDPAGDLIDFHDMTVGLSVNLTTGRVELKSDASIHLKITNAERVSGGSGDDTIVGNASGNTIAGGGGSDTISGGASAGTVATTDIPKYTDTLDGGAGNDTITAGGDYNILTGGAGVDLLTASGRESHLYGGEGNDIFQVGAQTFVEETDGRDHIYYGGIQIYGGVKQWWAEGNTAYWAPFSTLSSAFPVIGSELIYTAAVFTDTETMKFAAYMRDANGFLVMKLGWGHGGQAMIRDYNVDFDSGIGSANISVFATEHGDGTATALARIQKLVNVALYAGFGVGLPGYDPLVLDLDGDGFELTTEQNSHAYFEFDNDGFGERTGWVRPDDGLLAIDLNSNGKIDDVTELFGNQTTSGFTMLAAYDLNTDGVIDADDAVYADLRVWRDLDQDGVTDTGELQTLTDLGIVSITLAGSEPEDPTFVGGNEIARTGSFTWADASTGGIADVSFTINETASSWLGDSTVSSSAALLPELRGFGIVKDLRVAMTGDATLEDLVSDFAASATTDLAVLKADAEAILYQWAGVAGVTADAIGSDGFDARKLAFLEAYSGCALMERDGGGDPLLTNIGEMEALWADQVTRLTLRLVVQGPLADAFDGITYHADLDLLVADTATALGDLYGRLLDDLPADSGDALAQWQAWAPLLGAMAEGMVRFDNNVVRADYIAAQLLAAMDGIDQPLDFDALAGALGIANLSIGTAGNDALARGAAEGTAIYLANGGTDTIEGGGGQDVYIFGRDIGHVTIDDEEAHPAGDRLRFAFLNPDDVSLVRDGDDLLITVTATGETVRVLGQFADVVPLGSDLLLSSDKGIEDIQFADGSVWETPEIMSAVGTGTSGDDHMVGTMHSDVFLGGLGDDLLEGGDDADLYVVKAGEGDDVIHDVQTTPLLRAADLLIFGEGIAPSDLAFSRVNGGDDLLITVGAAGQSVLIEGEFAYTVLGYNYFLAPNSRIEAFAFSDYGDSWGIGELQQRLIAQDTTAGDDTTLGFGDDDTFGASAGDDLLIGLDGQDRYQWGAGAGNDVIDERSLYIDVNVGLGGLSLTDEADTVQLLGLVQADIVFSRASGGADLTVTNISTGETLTIVDQFAGFQTGPLGAQWLDRIEWFEFADASRVSWQEVLADVTTGGDGDDHLWGDLYEDRLTGGLGDDVLSGRGYADTYVFNLGDGHDTLADDNHDILGAGFVTPDTTPDILELGPGIAPEDIVFERDGADLILVIGEDGDRITLQGQDDYFHTGVFGAFSYNRIEEVHFDDDTVWTWQDLNARAIAAETSAGDDDIHGFMMADRFEASAGDDILAGGDSGDTYVFGTGSGEDRIEESVSNVLFGDEDVVEFGPGILPGDVTVSRDGDDLILTLAATGDTLTIAGEFAYSAGYTWNDVELFRFAGGTEWTKADVQEMLLAGSAGADHLIGFGSDDDLAGLAGDDILEGGDGSDTYRFGIGGGDDVIRETVTNMNLGEDDRLVFGAGIAPGDVTFSRDEDDLVITLGSGGTMRIEGQFNFASWFAWNDVEHFDFAGGASLTSIQVAAALLGGTSGADHLVGTFRSDTLDGGAGNDLLEGGDGADIYLFGLGYGQDEIRESVSEAILSEQDQLRFGPGIALADLTFARDGASDTLTITDQFAYASWYTWWDVDQFRLDDGTTLAKEDVQQIILAEAATAGDDHIIGFMTGDTLDGGAGNDILEGGDGSDTYVFGIGSGQDEIREWIGEAILAQDDTILFGAGVHWSDLAFALDGDTLIITIAGTSDSLTLTGQFTTITDTSTATWWDVENFVFADGTAKTTADVIAAMIAGTAGNDHLVGVYTNDNFVGGLGDDLLEGQRGNDSYVFNLGDGNDTIRDFVYYWGSYDQLVLGSGIAPADVRFSRSAADTNDMVLSFATGAGSITLDNQFYSGTEWGVDEVVFAGGTVWTKAQLQAAFDAATQNNSAPELVAGSSDVEAAFAEIEDVTGLATLHDADGVIVFSDAEAYDAHSAEILSVDVDGAGDGLPDAATLLGWLSLDGLDDQEGGAGGSVAWAFAAADSAFDYLADGETATLTYVVAIADGYGGTLEQDVTVEVNGRNDAPSGLDIAAVQTIAVPMTVDGHALRVSPNVYQLTPDGTYAYGAIWGEIDLGSDTLWTTRVFFGGQDYWGADGLAFAIGANPSFNGTTAYALGVLASGNIGIKFDNYANGEMGDPGDDFSQFVLNGNVSTSSTAFDARHTHANLENNAWHDLVIAWDAATHTLGYSLDGTVIASKVYDISDLLLDGGSEAWFGFGAATGGLTNYQSVEIVSISQSSGDLGVNENAAAGTVIGHLTGHDPDAGSTLSYAITDGEGEAVSDSMFVLDGDALKVKTGAAIDYETATSHGLYIKVSDGEGGQQIVYVNVAINNLVDTNEAPDGLALVGGLDVAALTLAGSAANLGDGEYRLTQDWGYQTGSVWGAVDLAADITWNTRMFFGANDYWGADGMAFALRTASPSTTGGYGVLSSSSFGIRFDTYYNSGEPGGDFSQFSLNNGGAQSFDPFHQHANLENNAWHDVVIHWDAASHTLSYSVDGVATAAKAYDVATELFSGSTQAWFGFGGATGGLANYQAVEILSVDSEITHYEVSETIADGALVAYLDGSDPNDDALTYTIVDEFGDAVSDTIFEIDNGDELRIKGGALLDADTEPTHDLYVQVSDGSGLTYLAHLVCEVI